MIALLMGCRTRVLP